MSTLDAETYIAQYGGQLSESEKRYIRAFGPPTGFQAGASRNPYTPGLRVGNAPTPDEEARERSRRLDREAGL